MKYSKIFNKLGALVLAATLFASCDKIDEPDPIGTRGQTIVKVVDGGTPGEKAIAIDFVNNSQTVDFVDVRRDVPNETELNKSMTVVLKDDTAALRRYNEDIVANGGTALVYLPASWYTLSTPRVGGVGGTYTVTLAPGEFAKQIAVTVPNATLLDPSTQYALAFTIVSTDPAATIAANRTVIVKLGAKNIYDGRYAVTGTLVDVTNPAFGPWLPSWEAHLVTTGANTNDVYDETYTGIIAHPFFNAGAPTYYGSFGMQITFNQATNVITNMKSPYEPASNTRTARLDPSFVSYFDPVSHNIRIRYFMYQPSVVASGPRVIFDETWTYLGPR